MPKRRMIEDVEDVEESTPRKTRRAAKEEAEVASPSVMAETPSKRKSILRGRPTPTKINGASGASGAEATPKSLRKVLFSTPAKAADVGGRDTGGEETPPTAVRNDQSARRKSARTLQQQRLDDGSDDEEGVREAALAEEILDEDDSEEEVEVGADVEIPIHAASTANTNTPSKRGRPKGKRRERTPSPPPDLPPHELYFFQNRTGGNKTSANALPSHLLLNHEHYFTQINRYQDPHEDDVKRLKDLHKRSFDQWMFELDESFNLCLYGYGSKRQLVMEFADHVYHQAEKVPKIVVVNGYTPGLTIRDVLTTLAGVVIPKTTKLPAQPPAILELLLSTLSGRQPTAPIHLIIHSFDHANLRKASTQSLLARLAAHLSIRFLITCDTTAFPLLWDTTLLRQFRWLYHDTTTFLPYTAELDAVEEVGVLLGRSGRRLGGKDGVGYVLKSLPENARNLFRILVAEQLATMDMEPDAVPGAEADHSDADDILGAEDEEEAAAEQNTPSRRGRGRKPKKAVKAPKPVKVAITSAPEGVEYRTLYHKAVEEFVCSSELNFRTLLREFLDHQMLESRKDGLGTERLVVPFRREELEGILEELV